MHNVRPAAREQQLRAGTRPPRTRGASSSGSDSSSCSACSHSLLHQPNTPPTHHHHHRKQQQQPLLAANVIWQQRHDGSVCRGVWSSPPCSSSRASSDGAVCEQGV
jgi:hypothetical protein